MGRLRIIDRDAVLTAAETVVRRDGAARLTIEAVAAEAGISKASVLYDYKTKQALIKAVVERRVAAECERVRKIIEEFGAAPDSAIQGCIAAAANRSLSDADREVALCLTAALAQDPELRAPIQEKCRQQIAEILETSSRPRNALLAFLALEGLKLLECLGIYTWPEDERKRLLEDISGLAAGRLAAEPGRSAQG
ncbi:MAG TPA: TetR/AcrR family transcriptional regulator [Hyphomicrobiaceae bacterium]|nr:TetR/AcrR family transcriptional regulator [Hyphomicrobiaceae bacterium]